MRKLSKSLEDYLEMVLVLELEGKRIHSIEIARRLNVSKAAVANALKRLTNRGLIHKPRYQTITFTKAGRHLAKTVYHRHTTIKKFLLKIGVEEEIAEKDCCKIEHVISEATLKALDKELKTNK